MDRRTFLLSLAASWGLPACHSGTGPPLPPGAFVGPSMERGHRLRGRDFPAPTATRRVGVAIVGGGVAGLSAAWKLSRSGFGDFRLFELEDETGGNARAGRNPVSAYPWGAHYLPVPGPEARDVRELLADLGVLLGDPYAPAPAYQERHLCFAPQERLYRHGLWQEGLLPQIGASPRDQEQYRRFFAMVEGYRRRRDRQGRRAFAIPSALSSTDPDLLALDRISMRAHLLGQGLDSPLLHWYVNYACRDDYGTHYGNVSAWAGLHYFAARDGSTRHGEGDQVLTWPEGNTWLTREMARRFPDRIETAALVQRIQEGPRQVELDVYLPRESRTVRWQAKAVIFAAPLFILPHVAEGLDEALKKAVRRMDRAPWLVANLTLSGPPDPGNGAPLSWDNVLYDSPTLGYVVATHQHLRVAPGPTVLTHYWAFSGEPSLAARRRLQERPWNYWAQRVLGDLAQPHPDLAAKAQRLDLFRWSHAMARPVPGWIWSTPRLSLSAPRGRLLLAHSDLSGFSIFEEANYWGVRAAEKAIGLL